MECKSVSTDRFNPTPARLLLIAAVLHVCVALTVFASGRLQITPTQFDTNGIGAFAEDGHVYRIEVENLAGLLRTKGFRAWWHAPAELHLQLFSLAVAPVQRWTNVSVATIEPLNLNYYLLALVLVFNLGKEVFDQRAGLLAAVIVGLWPSFLLHTTQMLKDPFLVIAFLALILIYVQSLTRVYSIKRMIAASLIGALATVAILISRLSMWDVVRAIAVMGLIFLVIRQVRQRRFLKANCASAAFLILVILMVPHYRKALPVQPERDRPLIAERVSDLPVWERITRRRQVFLVHSKHHEGSAGSTIDQEVPIKSNLDLIRFLPRAMAVGLFAPFPNMWVGQGRQVGTAGRWLSGAEMLVTYLIEILAAIAIWQNRRELTVWLLTAIAILGTTGLGLIVLNIGTLYRLRYPFWILVVVLGAGGAVQLIVKKPRPAAKWPA